MVAQLLRAEETLEPTADYESAGELPRLKKKKKSLDLVLIGFGCGAPPK
jgi:hypothetical protein